MSLNFDNAMYQTTAIFQKSTGFLEWESISLFHQFHQMNYFKTVSKSSILKQYHPGI